MTKVGIVEGFFGPQWSHEARINYASFLKKVGGHFYIYAPKRDAYLRKLWREEWPENYLRKLKNLKETYHHEGLEFGVALSPFGLGSVISPEDWYLLKEKLKILSDLGLDQLGLFFDDMPSTEKLLQVQSDVVRLALEYFPSGLIFCPSYYTFDPILDKVFGERPKGYMEGLKDFIPPEADICWTGPKVISEEITRGHLEEVESLLGRSPFIWENLYANDGPKNCKFLKLKFFNGRDFSLKEKTKGIAFNLMNQPYLSQILFLSSLLVLEKKISPVVAFGEALRELVSPELALFLERHRLVFLQEGLDQITEELKKNLLHELQTFSGPVAKEMIQWLKGEYLVGPECLTD